MAIRQARRIKVTGVVQGVGFRPFVYQLAQKSGLTGWVRNTSGDVSIVVEGEEDRIRQFLAELKKGPPQSHIEALSVSHEPLRHFTVFEIKGSLVTEGEYQLVSPDLATCSECRKEIFNPADRRYRYPFTNCTNCGPRFTIIQGMPYDRPFTTMRDFQMCPACRKEYEDPLDRRFHAQPNACPICGPRLELVDAEGKPVPAKEVISKAITFLREGRILAIKGLGGFLLACDATNDKAVRRLRERKHRPAKPFAVMVKDLAEARRYCRMTVLESKLLTSPAAPIVLMKHRKKSAISCEVAPGLAYLGVMLPYTPLHYILMQEIGLPLVMTSGNLSEEPIAADNSEALQRLRSIADYFILHNRDIYSRYDDSVAAVVKRSPQIIRRARGYAPFPIALPFSSRPVLACGAEMKNTFCLTRDKHAFLSQHIGDMENEETLENFEKTLRLYEKLFRIQPDIIACDLHPDYLPSQWARGEAERLGLELVPVQHHYAHILSCMMDNRICGPVIGVAFDGTGYGTDGRVWGGEFMIADTHNFQRKAHFEYLPLPGGSAAIQKPYRIAAGYLYSTGENLLNPALTCFKGIDEIELELIKKQVDQNINTPLTSSCGRLFDAVSSLLGIRQQIEYEGQAAVELEMVAEGERTPEEYPFAIEMQNGVRIIRVGGILGSIIWDIERGVPVSRISAVFHNTIARIIAEISSDMSEETGIRQVALSGGVFQNRRLLRRTVDFLTAGGLTALLHSDVPCNDGGISLGQAVVANFINEGDGRCV